MADTDLIFQIIAQDKYTAELAEARVAVSQMTAAEKQQALAAHDAAQADDELGKATKDAGDSAKESTQGFESFKGTLVAVQSGVMLAQEALSGLKQVWEFGKEGAANQQIAASFDRTAKSIGSSANEIIAKLNEAAKGTIDDEDLMQASTRALTLGVAKNGDDLVKVMQLARAAALQFGGDTGSAFETINYAIGNLTPRTLKQFGIIVDLKEAYRNYAASIGVAADQLTEEQQRQALLNDVLEKGKKNFGDISNATATTAENMKAVEVQWQNTLDILKEIVAMGFGALFTFTTEGPRRAMQEFRDVAASLRVEVANGRMSVKDYNDALTGIAMTMRDNGFVMRQVDLDTQKLTEDQGAQSRALVQMGQDSQEAARQQQYLRDAQRDLALNMREVEQGARNQSDTYNVLNGAMDQTSAKAALLSASQKMLAEDAKKAAEAQQARIQSHDAYMAALGNEIKSNDALAQSLNKATTAQATQILARSAIDALKEAYDKNALGALGLEKAVQAVEIRYGLATPQSIAMAEAQSKLNDALIAGQIPADAYVMAIGKIPQVASDGTVTTEELSQLGIRPIGVEFDTAREKAHAFIDELGRIPNSVTTTITVSTPSIPNPDTRTYPLMGGAAAGADFITPPNPRGGSGDYFSVMSAPGERVQITPSGGMSGGANFNVTLNIGGSSASATEIQAAVYDALNDVIRSAGLSA